MTMDEAIHSFIQEAEEQEQLSKTGKWFEGEDWNIKARQNCAETASNCRQIIAWLNELKQLREENEQLKEDLDKAILYGLKMERQVLDFIFPNAKHSKEGDVNND
jgi:hypothetical protein